MRILGSVLLALAQLRPVLGIVACALLGPVTGSVPQSCEESHAPAPAGTATLRAGSAAPHDDASNGPCASGAACAPSTVAIPRPPERLEEPRPHRSPALLATQVVPDNEPLAPPTPPPNS